MRACRARADGRPAQVLTRLIGKRRCCYDACLAIPSLIGVVIVTFLLTRALPGDPAAYFAGPAGDQGGDRGDPRQARPRQAAARAVPRYIGDLAHGDLGNSLTTGQPVATEIRNRLPASAELTLLGLIVSVAIAMPLGILAATRPGSWIDHLCRVVTTAGVSLPVFFTGLLLVYVFYYHARLVAGAARPARRVLQRAAHGHRLLPDRQPDRARLRDLPVGAAASSSCRRLTLAIFSLAPIARMTRASMLAVLASDFVRTARASGLSPCTVIVTYAFRNAMLPVITTLGMVFSFLLGANVLVEKVFAWPGIGSYAVEALIASDFAPVQGFVLTMAVMYVLLNLLIDILYGVIDPRVRLEGMSDVTPSFQGTCRVARMRHPAADAAHTRATCSARIRVTGFAFGLFVLIVLAALFGPYIVPYDPLASNTAQALQAAVARALVRHRPARPRHLQPRHRGDAARLLHRRRLGRRWCS